MSPYVSTEAVVINKRNHRDSNLQITLLSPKLGKISCLAIGVKNIKSSRSGALQLGNIIRCSLYSKNNYYWISEAKANESFLNTPKTLTQLNLLFYFLEIINQVIAENQSVLEIYPIVKKIIIAINQNQLQHFIKYEINFINHLGFGIPEEINLAYQQDDFKKCQSLLKKHLESIIEKPLTSNQLFK